MRNEQRSYSRREILKFSLAFLGAIGAGEFTKLHGVQAQDGASSPLDSDSTVANVATAVPEDLALLENRLRAITEEQARAYAPNAVETIPDISYSVDPISGTYSDLRLVKGDNGNFYLNEEEQLVYGTPDENFVWFQRTTETSPLTAEAGWAKPVLKTFLSDFYISKDYLGTSPQDILGIVTTSTNEIYDDNRNILDFYALYNNSSLDWYRENLRPTLPENSPLFTDQSSGNDIIDNTVLHAWAMIHYGRHNVSDDEILRVADQLKNGTDDMIVEIDSTIGRWDLRKGLNVVLSSELPDGVMFRENITSGTMATVPFTVNRDGSATLFMTAYPPLASFRFSGSFANGLAWAFNRSQSFDIPSVRELTEADFALFKSIFPVTAIREPNVIDPSSQLVVPLALINPVAGSNQTATFLIENSIA